MDGTELPGAINESAVLLHRLESILADAAYTAGMAASPRLSAEQSAGSPKIGVLCPPISYTTLDGGHISSEDIDICVRMLSMGKAHKACPLTAANAIAAAALLPGTLAHALCRPQRGNTVRIGHPSGVMGSYRRHSSWANSLCYLCAYCTNDYGGNAVPARMNQN